MSLLSGSSLSFYEILGPLGAGAMGEVYRARDTRLDREVAIKVLPEHFADDDERLRRFEREAKALASLNHSNVAQIFGVDQVKNTCFLVLELVPGETLEERLSRGALPLEEALELCCQIADGLEAAHRAGVIHRDLKPANLCITPEGQVKVLDFGLAKPSGPEAASGASTDSVLATEAGRMLGTPTYMAPEQVRGKPIDRRVDMWAFGCVLFECLTAKRAFGGETLSDVLAAVLQQEPDWSLLPDETPVHVRNVLTRCLVKDTKQRLRDAGDAGLMLASPLDAPVLALQGSAQAGSGARRMGAGLAAGLVLGVAAGLTIAFTGAGDPQVEAGEAPITLTSVHVSKDQAVRAYGGSATMAISPDSGTLAWVGGVKGAVYVRSLDSFDVRCLPGTENTLGLFFSPDSKRLGFLKEGALMSIATSGGSLTKITDVQGKQMHFRGACWGDDGNIVFAPSIATGLFRVPESGGALEAVTELDPASEVRTHRYPFVLPGSEVVLYTQDDKRTSEYHDDASIVARSMVTGEERVIVEGAGQARYAAGQVVFVRAAELYSQAFDPETLSVSGTPRKIITGVEYDTTNGLGHFDLSKDGALVHMPGIDRTRLKRVAWRRQGEPAVFLDLPPGSYESPRVSPDGRYISWTTWGADHSELWLYDIERETSRRRLKQADMLVPIWSRASDRIYFGSGLASDPAIYVLDVEGASPPRVVFEGEPDSFLIPSTMTLDGKPVVVFDNKKSQVDIRIVDPESGEGRDLIATPSIETQPAIDPSGKWLAFTREQAGDTHIFLTTLAPDGPLLQVSLAPSRSPRWAPDGTSIYFLPIGKRELWAVDIQLKDQPTLEAPHLVLEDFYWDVGKQYVYDVAPDGSILTLADDGGSELGRELRVQSDWLREGVLLAQ
ncbi:MAG: Tol biopolymer transport system component/tRNA A-37 threonylcarbamoyl transferase component Bud32 [Planctomycetota bacterium]|jgi:Tol biopolymer transport system component/tRNA A-37 threonylcarbamoyl transferase component Bud32